MFKELTIQQFRDKTGITNNHLPNEGLIIPLSHLARRARVHSVMIMETSYLDKMFRPVTLAGDHQTRLYAQSSISVERISPFGFSIIQTFIQRSKYRDFLEYFDRVFEGFHVSSGVAKKKPMIVIGEDKDSGQTLIAHYLPPIVEIGPSGVYLADGIHRSFLAGSVGTTIEAIIIKNVSAPARARLLTWSELRFVDDKPPITERSLDNDPKLYRRWEDVGIDG